MITRKDHKAANSLEDTLDGVPPKTEGPSASTCSRLPDLRERFPKIRGIKYEPDSSCHECGGSGVSSARTLKSGTKIGDGPCACIFLGEHTREIKTALAGVARNAFGENAIGEARADNAAPLPPTTL